MSRVDEKRAERAIELAKDGVKVTAIAQKLNFSLQQFYRWRRRNPDLHQELKGIIKTRSSVSGGDDKLQLFEGFPGTEKEVARRRDILRSMRVHGI